KPSLILSTAVFPISEHERIQKIQQHWELWAQRGDVDVIVTMSYAMDTNRLQRLVMPWLDHADALGPVLVLPSIRLHNLPNANAFQQIQAIRDMPSGGYSLFAVADLNDTLQVMFSRTQGVHPTTRPDPIPYRQPFHTALARYESLQREWSVMLANGELRVWNSQQTIWNTQTAALDQALRALASNPSEQRLNTAKHLLYDFRTQLDDWVSLQSNNDDYRLRTWNNRLEAMDTLLNYGNHFILQRQARR
ncbi:MAG TPA: glycoside hydrolase family 10 protein, partial [Chroococcidiopsis sp.]